MKAIVAMCFFIVSLFLPTSGGLTDYFDNLVDLVLESNYLLSDAIMQTQQRWRFRIQ